MPESIPPRLGPFQLDRTLGLSMGYEVLRATVRDAVPGLEELKPGMTVVLKRLLPDRVDDPDARAGLEREVTHTMRADRVATQRALGLWRRPREGHEAPEIIAVFSFREGQDLHELAAQAERTRRPMTTLEVVALSQQLIAALEALHQPVASRALRHGDVASRNVLIAPNGNVELLDLGESSLVSTSGHVSAEPGRCIEDASPRSELSTDREDLAQLLRDLWRRQHPDRAMPTPLQEALRRYLDGVEVGALGLDAVLAGVHPQAVLKAWQLDLNESPIKALEATPRRRAPPGRWRVPLTVMVTVVVTAYYLMVVST